MIPSNACHPRITAAAGTELAVAYSLGTVSYGAINPVEFFPNKSSLRSEDLRPARGVALSDFRPLLKILDCSLP